MHRRKHNMGRTPIIVLILMAVVLANGIGQQQATRVRVPTMATVERLSPAERRELEILFASTVEQALKAKVVVPGQYIDLSDPNIRFVREYNLWVEKRTAIVRSFGIDALRHTIDVKELAQFDRVVVSFEAYCAEVERNYAQYKRTKKAFKGLERAVNKERDGVYRDH